MYNWYINVFCKIYKLLSLNKPYVARLWNGRRLLRKDLVWAKTTKVAHLKCRGGTFWLGADKQKSEKQPAKKQTKKQKNKLKEGKEDKRRKREQAEKQELFISYRWKSICLFTQQVSYRANIGLPLVYHT